jgi:hypothetical protein
VILFELVQSKAGSLHEFFKSTQQAVDLLKSFAFSAGVRCLAQRRLSCPVGLRNSVWLTAFADMSSECERPTNRVFINSIAGVLILANAPKREKG